MVEKILMAVLVSLFLLCAGIGLVVLVYLWLVWYVSFQERRPTAAVVAAARGGGLKGSKQQGLSEADLQRLPTVECRTTEGGEGGATGECAVCLESFESGERCRLMPMCRHSFHVHCADAWLSKRSVCPICRCSACDNSNNNDNLEKNVAFHSGPRPPDNSAMAVDVN